MSRYYPSRLPDGWRIVPGVTQGAHGKARVWFVECLVDGEWVRCPSAYRQRSSAVQFLVRIRDATERVDDVRVVPRGNRWYIQRQVDGRWRDEFGPYTHCGRALLSHIAPLPLPDGWEVTGQGPFYLEGDGQRFGPYTTKSSARARLRRMQRHGVQRKLMRA